MNTSLVLFSKEEAESACKKDSHVALRPNKYVKENTLTYYIGVNTWLHIIKECDPYAWTSVRDLITKNGLLAIIKMCDEDATRLVQCEEPLTDIGRLLASIAGAHVHSIALHPEKNFLRDELATALQLLRYLKRFSPQNNDEAIESSLRKFTAVENRNKLLQRKEYPVWLISEMKDIISEILPWNWICSQITHRSNYEFKISPGKCAEGLSTLGAKIRYLSAIHPECFMAPFGLPYIIPYYDMGKPGSDYHPKEVPSDASQVRAVPKSYKAARIIAMEPLYRQAISGWIADKIKIWLPPELDITDQSRNQQFASIGSSLGNLATLDASNASDTITKTLFRSVFPPKFVQLVDPLLSTYTQMRNKPKRTMQMASTAGHSLTFIIETIIYYAVARAATRIVSRFEGKDEDDYLVSVYGDDVIISTECVETALDFYGMLGFIINIDKSYIDGPYRESCGEEYWNGIPVSTTYYPRFPITGTYDNKGISLGSRLYRDEYRGKTDDSTTMLVDLQKRLFGVSHGASCFVREIIRKVRPKLTSSVFGSDRPDLWDYVEVAPRRSPKGYVITRMYRDNYRGTTLICRGGVGTSDMVTWRKLLRNFTPLPSSTRFYSEVELSPSVIDSCEYTLHSYVGLQYKVEGDIPWPALRSFEIYKYQNFLKTGPSYSDPLLKLLGVSDPPISVKEAFGKGTLVWKYSKE